MPGCAPCWLASSDQFVTTLTEKLLTYAVGRDLGLRDAPAVRSIVRARTRTTAAFLAVILGIVESLPFQMRRADR